MTVSFKMGGLLMTAGVSQLVMTILFPDEY